VITVGIDATVHDGRVDLGGLVHSPEEKKRPRIAAELTLGVRAVVDNIVGRPPAQAGNSGYLREIP
jgi:osmotically-inducible protein OsmY